MSLLHGGRGGARAGKEFDYYDGEAGEIGWAKARPSQIHIPYPV